MSAWEVWDRLAATLPDAKAVVWAEPDWEGGVVACVDQLAIALAPIGQTGGRILDLGCGIGRLIVPLAQRWPEATFVGFDVSQRMLGYALIEVDRGGVFDRVEFALGDAKQAHLMGAIDGAYSVAALQHMWPETQERYVREIGKRLSRGGILRCQFVKEGDTGPLAHPLPTDTMVTWCEEAGMRVENVEDGGVIEVWTWLTAVKA